MKQFTDIEQSERLREILPIASADAYWVYDNETKRYVARLMDKDYSNANLPCWSIHALLGVFEERRYWYKITHACCLVGECYSELRLHNADDTKHKPFLYRQLREEAIDACYDTIMWLYKNELL